MNKLVKVAGLMLLSIAFVESYGQGYRSIKKNSDLLYHTTKSLNSSDIKGYLEHLPPDYYDNPTKQYPMIIFLHGSGERGNGDSQLFKAAKHGPPKEVERLGSLCFTVNGQEECFIVLSPQLEPGNWSDAAQQPFWDHVYNGPDNYRFDPNRVYLTGLSLGGNGVWRRSYQGNNIPNKLAAMAPIAGWGNNSKACIVAENEIPIWAFHGINDGTVNYDRGYSMFNAVDKCANAASTTERIFTTIQGGHNIWFDIYKPDNSIRTPNLYQWFLTQNLDGTVTNGNESPTVDAGDSIITDVSAPEVQVTASASDPDGTIINYNWKKLIGPNVTISDSNKPTMKLTDLQAGVYEFRITVKDDDGATSSDRVNVIIDDLTVESSGEINERTSSDGMSYLEYLPELYDQTEPLPVIIYLHTSEAEGSIPTVILNEGPFKYLNQGEVLSQSEQIIVLAPQVQMGNGFKKGELQRFYDYMLNEYSVDENRVYIIGADEGATDLAYRLTDISNVTADRWAAAAIISGNAPASIGCDIGNTDISLYIGHSTTDSKYDYNKAQSLFSITGSCSNGDMLFTTLSGNHDDAIDNALNPNSSDLYAWLLSHTRGEEIPDTTEEDSTPGVVNEKVTNKGVSYLEYLPPSYNPDLKYPAIVYFHSEGAEGEDLNLIRGEGPFYYIDQGENLCVGDECFVIFAFQVEVGSGFWKGKTDKFYDYLVNNYNLDPDRIYLTGYDDGASNALSRLADNTNTPNRWAAIAAVGYKVNETHGCNIAASGANFYLAHSVDDEIDPFEVAQSFADAVDQCTSQEVLFKSLTGSHSQSWETVYDPTSTDLYTWLLGHQTSFVNQSTVGNFGAEINVDRSIGSEDELRVGLAKRDYLVKGDILKVDFANRAASQINVFSLDGRLIVKEYLRGAVSLDKLEGSVYLYNITDESGVTIQRGKILKY
ncbi:MAG: hypothetical protein AAFN93_02460 [Bacteroidota bacterium]